MLGREDGPSARFHPARYRIGYRRWRKPYEENNGSKREGSAGNGPSVQLGKTPEGPLTMELEELLRDTHGGKGTV